MDISLLIRHRLKDLGLDQKDLAGAAQVTESYISQLLARKKAPPAPARTDLYDRIGQFLRLPEGELARLAELQRQEELKNKVELPRPLFKDCRALVLRKCDPASRSEVASIFEKQAFGELERLVTQTLLEAAQGVARDELRSEEWLRVMGELTARSYEEMRVAMLEFLDSDVFNVSMEGCVSFLDPIIECWDIDLKTISLVITLNPRLAPERVKRYAFVEQEERGRAEPGLEDFLNDAALSSDITEDEIEFLRKLQFRGRRPSALYYYRELQNLRDPLHFPAADPVRSRT